MSISRPNVVFRLASLSREIEVKYHGQYTLERVHELAAYQRETTLLHAFGVLVLSLLPCVAITTIVDVMPLDPPFEGIERNSRFFLRLFEVNWILSVLALVQFQRYVSELTASNFRVVVISAMVSAATLGCDYVLSMLVGFPLPFTYLLSAVFWVNFMILALVAIGAYRILSTEHQRQHLINALRVWVCQFCLIGAWTLYFTAYVATPPSVRPALMLVLPMMKVLLRRGFSRALPHLRDEGPEIVTFNTDVFSSLFLSISAQSTSYPVTIGLMVLDGLRGLWTVRSLHQKHKEMKTLESCLNKLQQNSKDNGGGQMLVWANSRLQELTTTSCGAIDQSESLQHSTAKYHAITLTALLNIKDLKLPCRINRNASLVAPDTLPQSSSSNERVEAILPISKPEVTRQWKQPNAPRNLVPEFSECVQRLVQLGPSSQLLKEERELTELTLPFLHTMEFVLLMNYVEAAIPFVYGAYVAITLVLPNRKYYVQFADIDASAVERTSFNLLLYFIVQMTSLLVVCAVYESKFKISGVKQIAFVLERQWVGIQSKLVFWLFFNAQISLVHAGHDYTFKFVWL